MFEYAASSLIPSLTMSPLSTPDIVLFNQKPEQSKAAQYFIYQPYTLQVIQLVEGSPPPPRTNLDSRASSFASSSCSSDDESVSSYCSSDEDHLEQPLDSPSLGQTTGLSTTHTDSSESNFRLQRVLAWRKDFSSSVAATTTGLNLRPASNSNGSSTSLKRRMDDEEDSTDSVGSKRARSHGHFGPYSSVEYACTACDLRFSTLQSLRRHGSYARITKEACFIAVQYAFEQANVVSDSHYQRQ